MGRFSSALFGSCTVLGVYSRGNRLSCGFGQAVRWPVGTLQSCPALALRGIPPSLAVTCPFRAAYVPHAHVFPWCQRLYFPQGLGWTRTSDVHPSYRAALPTELQVHMVSRRRGGRTAGRLEGKEREEGAGACTILPRLYCKTSIWLFKFNLHPLARNFSPPF